MVLHQSNSLLQGMKKPAMIMWVGLYRQVPAPLVLFPLFTVTFGLGVNGIWWGLSVVNWSAALFMLFFALRLMQKKTNLVPPALCGSEAVTISS